MQTTCASLPRKTVTQPLIAGKFRCKRYKNKLQKNQETEQSKKKQVVTSTTWSWVEKWFSLASRNDSFCTDRQSLQGKHYTLSGWLEQRAHRPLVRSLLPAGLRPLGGLRQHKNCWEYSSKIFSKVSDRTTQWEKEACKNWLRKCAI